MKRSSLTVAGRIFLIGFLVFSYPGFVLGYTWIHVAISKFPGGRGGPLDAYRHTLASAVVAYTIDTRAVALVSSVMERGGSSSNEMDRHNNSIGAKIGLRANSFCEIEPAVIQAIRDGVENSQKSDQITWLSQDHWRDSLFY